MLTTDKYLSPEFGLALVCPQHLLCTGGSGEIAGYIAHDFVRTSWVKQ